MCEVAPIWRPDRSRTPCGRALAARQTPRPPRPPPPAAPVRCPPATRRRAPPRRSPRPSPPRPARQTRARDRPPDWRPGACATSARARPPQRGGRGGGGGGGGGEPRVLVSRLRDATHEAQLGPAELARDERRLELRQRFERAIDAGEIARLARPQ